MRYDPKTFEEKWRKKWLEEKVYEPDFASAKKPFYHLMMFPYPSAEGLHIGSVRTFSGIDMYGRMKRMQGYDVFEPIGLDGFGIHSENYALKSGKHPMQHAKDSKKNFYRQLGAIGNGFAWEERLETYDPQYYRWTQWIFLQMFKRGLAYRKKSPVNWCPGCKTVLADEQVLQKPEARNPKSEANPKLQFQNTNHEMWAGVCERCDAPVTKKDLEQWFLKITDYAERLLGNLEKIDWPEPIKTAQRNWIGKSEGAIINFEIKSEKGPNFVFLHGYGGSPESDFWPWLKKEIERRGYRVQIPKLPHADKRRAGEPEDMEAVWKEIACDENTIIVGHSLGAVVAMKVVEKLGHSIRKLVLVGGFLEPKFRDHDRPFATTFNWNFDFTKIRENAKQVFILHDKDDPVIPRSQAEKLHAALGGTLHEIAPQKSHFNGNEEPSVLPCVLDTLSVFTTRPDTLFGATYAVLAPEHVLTEDLRAEISNFGEVKKYIDSAKLKSEEERVSEGKDKTGVELKGIKAVNSVNGEEIPVWVADYVLGGYGTGAIMAVPAHDKRDFGFAKKFGLPIRAVIEPTYEQTTEPGKIKAGEPFDHREAIIAIVKHWSEEKYIALKWKQVAWGTFITGGIEQGQTPEEAAIMEIKEEAGYLHPKFIKDFGVVHGKFYHVPKKTNRNAHAHVLYFELVDGEKTETSPEEKEIHQVLWLRIDELKRFLTPDTHQHGLRWLLGEEGAYTGDGTLANSGVFDRLETAEAKKKITNAVGGMWKTQFRLRDWLISRQRYWGPPIPIIYCDKCPELKSEARASLRYGTDYTVFDGEEFMIHAVPEKDLPVALPHIEDFRPTGTEKSPLTASEEFYKVRCLECGEWAYRETDVSDTFLDSAWYYLGYLMNAQGWKYGFGDQEFKRHVETWYPVDMYIGGAEHAVLHLLYVRFVAMALHDWGFVPCEEPVKTFRTHGLITKGGAKMSKSKGNVVNPDDYISAYGSDAVRMYLAFLAPLAQGGDFRDEGIRGLTRFLERVWNLANKKLKAKNETQYPKAKNEINRLTHKTIKKVTEDIESLQYNTAISALMTLVNKFEEEPEAVGKENIEIFLKLLAPFAPHLSEELWQTYFAASKKFVSIHKESWPKFDLALLEEEIFELVVQVNGKMRGKISLPIGANEEDARRACLNDINTKRHLGTIPKKIVFVPNRLINFVV